MRSPQVSTTRVALPSFGKASAQPQIPANVYTARLALVVERMRAQRLDALLVYADREHYANLAYLTGFDPRFEEAALLLSSDHRRKLLVGNECLGYLPDQKALGLEVELFQEFSLMGQSRSESRPLQKILREFGLSKGARVGCAGWKYFAHHLIDGGPRALEIPSYLADTLREVAGDPRQVVNANDIFMHVQDGLRLLNEPEQIVRFEHAACVTSEGVLGVLRRFKPNVSEVALEKYLETRGLPLNCHRMISFGDKAKRGLSSPSERRAQLGDVFTIGFGVEGALNCRAGVMAEGPRGLPAALREVYPKLAANYFHVVATWYENIAVGSSASSVLKQVEKARDKGLYKFAVNPGHYLHLDEWVHSPFSVGSSVVLRSGMMLQMDIIPVSRGPFCYINAEDGVALADGALRERLSSENPGMWRRIQARRRFMRDQLGIRMDESVLPLGNIPGWLPPYGLDLNTVFVRD